MHYRIVQDGRFGLWHWILLDRGRAVARSLDAFADAHSCRTALHRAFANDVALSEWGHPSTRTGQRRDPASEGSAAEDAEPSSPDTTQFEDVGLKKVDTREPDEGEAEPTPMPQIGR